MSSQAACFLRRHLSRNEYEPTADLKDERRIGDLIAFLKQCEASGERIAAASSQSSRGVGE
jgi:hypothetical protein